MADNESSVNDHLIRFAYSESVFGTTLPHHVSPFSVDTFPGFHKFFIYCWGQRQTLISNWLLHSHHFDGNIVGVKVENGE